MSKRQIKGTVIKKSGDKSISILVERRVKHAKYHKFIKKFKKYIVHDETNSSVLGDVVNAIECRPISKKKTFRVVELSDRKD